MNLFAKFAPINDESMKHDDAPTVEQNIVSGNPTQKPNSAPERNERKIVPGMQKD